MVFKVRETLQWERLKTEACKCVCVKQALQIVLLSASDTRKARGNFNAAQMLLLYVEGFAS